MPPPLALQRACSGTLRMKRLERYLFRNAAFATLVTTLALVGMVWVSQAVRQLDLVTGKGQSLWVFFQATLLLIPQLALIVIPIALFIGIIFTLNRLNADSELIVMSAAGLRPVQIARPFAVLALVTALFCAWLSLSILPNAARDLRELVTKVRADVITRILEEGRFVELAQKVVFHFRSKGEDGSLEGVMVQDRRQPKLVSTYIATRGSIIKIGETDYLILNNGSLQRQSENETDNAIVTFSEYVFDLDSLTEGEGAVNYRPRERLTWELLTKKTERWEAGRVRSELHDRFSAPLFAFAAAALAFAALGKPRTTRQGRGLTILAAVIALIAARSAAFGLFTFATGNQLGMYLMYALPIAVTLAALAIAFWPSRNRIASNRPPALREAAA
jgi:lipopolysaccharide export system permease protein